jgi:mycofactocin system FadH/OYE family oxidoreductase 1
MKLLEPLDLGRSVVAPSRVMFGPHETNLGHGRALSPAHTAYYARRSAGGAGVIVVEEASVHASDWPYERAPLASECGTGWRSVVDACAPAIVLAALGHSGGQGTSHWSQREMWAPSAVPEVASREVPKVMEQRDIDAVVRGFADAAGLAVASGCHGVEINAGQNSLIRQFLSGLTNMRGDDYGTDRARFLREVLGAVRSAIGSERVVALRLSVDELAPWAGIVPDAGAEVAVAIAPMIDVLTIVRGSIYSVALTRPDGHVEPGFAIGLARQVRETLRSAGHRTPVFAQGSIVEWSQAEWAINDDAADGVEMTRAQLADADLIVKLRAGAADQIRPCVLCNQLCKVRDNRNPIVSCVMDPRTGHELDDTPEPTAAPAMERTLTIVGAGVAGLETARIAALRGFHVAVVDRSPAAGGVLLHAAHGAGRGRLALAVDWLERECRRLGVDFALNTEIDAAALVELRQRGLVVIATGGCHGALPFVVDDSADLRHAVDVLASNEPLPIGPVVVWDPIGGPIALSVAELLATDAYRRDAGITLVTHDLLVGEKLSLTGDLAPVQVRLHGLGVRLVKQAFVRRVSDGKVETEDRFSGETSVLDANVFIACEHRRPDLSLDPDEALPQAGDRVAPRTIHEAVLEGRRVAMALPATRP